MLSVVFVAESFPTFGPLLDLVGGSTITLMALIFPAIFYLFLHAKLEKYGAMPLHNQETIGLAEFLLTDITFSKPFFNFFFQNSRDKTFTRFPRRALTFK